MSTPVHRVAVAVVHREGRWLVARRRASVHLGGMWEFPGGKCDGAEHASETALRELREECGVVGVAERVLEMVVCAYEDRVVQITPVICRWLAGEAEPLGSEECRWVTLEELQLLAMPAKNAEIIRRVCDE